MRHWEFTFRKVSVYLCLINNYQHHKPLFYTTKLVTVLLLDLLMVSTRQSKAREPTMVACSPKGKAPASVGWLHELVSKASKPQVPASTSSKKPTSSKLNLLQLLFQHWNWHPKAQSTVTATTTSSKNPISSKAQSTTTTNKIRLEVHSQCTKNIRQWTPD